MLFSMPSSVIVSTLPTSFCTFICIASAVTCAIAVSLISNTIPRERAAPRSSLFKSRITRFTIVPLPTVNITSFSTPSKPSKSLISEVAVPFPAHCKWCVSLCPLNNSIIFLPCPRSTMETISFIGSIFKSFIFPPHFSQNTECRPPAGASAPRYTAALPSPSSA